MTLLRRYSDVIAVNTIADQQRLFDDDDVSAASPQRHMIWFAEFCRYEKATAGPDPHMRAVVALCEDLPLTERIWRAHLYVGAYNVPSAEAIWREWPADKFILEAPLMEDWLNLHWKGLRTRRERRTVNSPKKFANYLSGFTALTDVLPTLQSTTSFDSIWNIATALPHVGRYAATKLAEIWHQLHVVNVAVPDIRSAGGWSPRAALQFLSDTPLGDTRDNSCASVMEADRIASIIKQRLLTEHDIELSWFELEVLLCEYKESYSTHRQYPGRSLDSELGYERAVQPYWGYVSGHLQVRRHISPDWALGELQGWPGVREALGHVLVTYGYVWSDSIFDYKASLINLANPVRKVVP